MADKYACRGRFSDAGCEFCSAWFCKNPDCLTPVLTSTLPGAHPSGCPLVDKWNSRKNATVQSPENDEKGETPPSPGGKEKA